MIKWSEAIEESGSMFFKAKIEPCKQHNHNNYRMGYVERQEWAERKLKQGHKQKYCPVCGYWYFKCDF